MYWLTIQTLPVTLEIIDLFRNKLEKLQLHICRAETAFLVNGISSERSKCSSWPYSWKFKRNLTKTMNWSPASSCDMNWGKLNMTHSVKRAILLVHHLTPNSPKILIPVFTQTRVGHTKSFAASRCTTREGVTYLAGGDMHGLLPPHLWSWGSSIVSLSWPHNLKYHGNGCLKPLSYSPLPLFFSTFWFTCRL